VKDGLIKVFEKYSGEDYSFDKTDIRIKLYQNNTEYLSRSQARRVVSGLDKFKTVILDFEGVDTVGQAFADEIFRVYQNNHPDKRIEYKNANDNVLFMIKRALS